MCNYNKTKVFPCDYTELPNHSILRATDDLVSNCDQNFETTISFDDIVHLIDKENIATYLDFDCGITFRPEAPTKVRQNNCELN